MGFSILYPPVAFAMLSPILTFQRNIQWRIRSYEQEGVRKFLGPFQGREFPVLGSWSRLASEPVRDVLPAGLPALEPASP